MFLLALNAIIKIAYVFFIDRQVQNDLGSDVYGTYAILFNFSFILQVILDMGIQNFNNREIARHNQLLGKYLSRIVPLKIMLGVFYLLICLMLAIAWGFEKEKLNMLLLLIFNQFLASFVMYLRTNISGLHLFKTDAVLSVLDRLVLVLLGLIVLHHPQYSKVYNIYWFVIGQTIAYSVSFIVAFTTSLLKSRYFRPVFSFRIFRSIAKKSLPYALLILLMSLYFRTDTILLGKLLPNGDYFAGIYMQSFRLVDALLIFGFLFAGLLLPIFSGMIKRNEPIDSLVNLAIRLMLLPLITLIIPSIIYNKEILDILYVDHHDSSGMIFSFLMLGLIGYSITYIYGTLLTANGSLRQLNIIAGTSVVLNIALNLVLIPRLYALGTAVSCLITQTYIVINQVFLCRKTFNLSTNLNLFFKFLLQVILVVISSLLLKTIFDNWIISWLISMILSVVAAFILKIIDLQDVYGFLRLRNQS